MRSTKIQDRAAEHTVILGKTSVMLPLHTRQIFIVDDNEIYAMMLDYFLSKDSVYHFVSFNSGEDCITNLYMNPDAVILDYNLPGMNGLQTLREIKRRSPHVHVLILSAHSDKKTDQELLAAGADYVIPKQGHGEKQIIDKIETLLSRKTGSLKEKSLFRTLSFFFLAIFLLALSIFFIQANY